jgi:hypothetical protein
MEVLELAAGILSLTSRTLEAVKRFGQIVLSKNLS